VLARRVATAVLAVATLVFATPAASSQADPGASCPPTVTTCTISVARPASPASPPANKVTPVSVGTRVCITPRLRQVVDCFDAIFGWFSNTDGCYYKLLDPQPAASDSVWEGHYPDGAIYAADCIDPIFGTNGGWGWLPGPPDGYAATATTPGELAARAVGEMQLAGPAIGITVTPDKTGLVGVPVWLWTAVTPTTWGPNTATATIPGLSVTATARASQITWDMGDGHRVTCPNAGTPYQRGGIESPTCDYIYQSSSAGQPGNAYALTATSTWEVTWAGGGTSGVLTVTRSSSTTVRIGELQVLVTS